MTTPASALPGRTVTHARVLAIAVPMTLAHVSTPLLGIADTAVIGQLGSAALIGAVTVGSIIFDALFWTFAFLRMGTTGLTAQALGAGDEREVRAALARAVLLGFAIGLALIVLQRPIIALSFYGIGPSPEVAAAAETYVMIRIWSAPFALANYALLGWFLGQARAKTGLALQIFLNGTNVIFSLTLVLGYDMGVAGVAIGTVIGEVLTLGLGLMLASRLLGGRLMVSRARLLDRAKIIATLAINRDIMIRTLALVAAYFFFVSQGASAGDTTLAANAILHKFILLGGYFLDGIAMAAEQLCGEAMGARARLAFRRAVKLSVGWSFVLAGLLSTLFLFAGGLLIDLMSTNEAVRETARLYLPYAAVTPLAGALAFALDGVFVGATWGRAMRDLMLLSLAGYFAVFALLSPILGNAGLWTAMVTFLAARGVTQLIALPFLTRRAFPG